MNFRSHGPETVKKAIESHIDVWELDTGSDGIDDVLIGDLEEVTEDILSSFELETLPKHWTLIPLNRSTIRVIEDA